MTHRLRTTAMYSVLATHNIPLLPTSHISVVSSPQPGNSAPACHPKPIDNQESTLRTVCGFSELFLGTCPSLEYQADCYQCRRTPLGFTGSCFPFLSCVTDNHGSVYHVHSFIISAHHSWIHIVDNLFLANFMK